MPYISLSWLRDHVQIPSDVTLADVAEDLVSVGFEEEEIHPPKVTGPLVVGRVLSVSKESQSNGKIINYCRVDVGSHNDDPGTGKEPSDLPSRGIICGAHNFEVDDYVVVSLPGAVLPGPFPIAARKTYGHVSDGMICSERELGLGNDHDGIIVLNKRFDADQIPAPGSDAIALLGLGEEVLEVNVTPDRGYGFSVRGLAREYSHSTGAAFVDKGLAQNLATELPPHSDDAFEVRVDGEATREGHAAADRFVTQVVRGIDPKAVSPRWMVERLEQAGMRSISLPVDVTNFVMLDLGQPLHAYAAEAIAQPFVVRRARAGEEFETLDGVNRQLDPQDIVISDSPDVGKPGGRIVGLAGVMGGLDSEVVDSTVDVVIEGAHFDSVSIARTSRRHRLSSEASKRFERGVDPQLAPVAVHRVAELLVEYGGGAIDPVCFDLNEVLPTTPVHMSIDWPRRLTGVDYSLQRIVQALEVIGASVRQEDDWLVVTPPTWRPDLVGPAHLVEEVARIDGYDRIPSILPPALGGEGLGEGQRLRRHVADTIAQAGGVEVLSYPFIGDAHDRQLLPPEDPRRQAAVLRNPLADDAPMLRTSLLDSLLDTATRNVSRGNPSLAIFELGTVTLPAGTVPSEIPGVDGRPTADELDRLRAGVPAQPWHAAGVLGGTQAVSSVLTPAREWDWADALEITQRLARATGVNLEAARAWLPLGTAKVPGPPVPEAASDPASVAPWHPGRVAALFVRSGKHLVKVGLAGELHPRVVKEYSLPARTAAFEVDLDALTSLVSAEPVSTKRVSVYPVAKIDLAVVVKDSIPAADVARVIRSASGPLLETLQLFDVYRGEQVGEGSRSLAFAVTLRAGDRTLSSDEVAKVRDKIVHDLGKRLKAALRA